MQVARSEEHTSELQSPQNLVCRLLLEKKNEKARSSNSTCNRPSLWCGSRTGRADAPAPCVSCRGPPAERTRLAGRVFRFFFLRKRPPPESTPFPYPTPLRT